MLVVAAAAAAAAVEDPSQEAEAAVAGVRAVGVEGVRMTGCCRTALLTEVNTVVAVAYQHPRNVVGCM